MGRRSISILAFGEQATLRDTNCVTHLYIKDSIAGAKDFGVPQVLLHIVIIAM